MKAVTGVLVVAGGLFLAGCDAHPSDCSQPYQQIAGTTKCSAVQVDYHVDTPTAIHDRLMAAVRNGDGIAINVTGGVDMAVSPDTITITSSNSGLITVSQDHWLPQRVADELTAAATKSGGDRINQLVSLIYSIHDWQDKNPRPASSSSAAPSAATVTAPAPPPVTVTVTAEPTKPQPPYDAMPILRGWGIAFGYVLFGVIVGRALRVFWKRNCRQCMSANGGVCFNHGFYAWLLGVLWFFGLPVVACMWVGDKIGGRDGISARQERKLAEARVRQTTLDTEKKKADTAYLEAAAVLGKAGTPIPDDILSQIQNGVQ